MNFFNLFKKKKQFHAIPRMYVIIRGDLSIQYGIIQGCHALAQFALKHLRLFEAWNNGYLIFLKVYNLKALNSLYLDIHSKNPGSNATLFCEPDLEGQATAIALYDNGELVDGLPLA